ALRRMLAQTLWYQKEYDAAVAELKKVIETDPCEVEAFEFMGRIAEDRPETASDPGKWFDDAISKNPDSALAYAIRAAYHLRHNDRSQAIADLTHATTCDLSDASVRLRVIAEFINAGDWEKAKEQLEALKATSPGELGLWVAWANLAMKRADKEGMRTVAEEGMKALGAEAWDFMPVAARLLIFSSEVVKKEDGSPELSDQAKIDEYLSQMRNKEIELPAVAYLQGLAAEKQGRLSEAVTHWQRAVSLPGADSQTLQVAYKGLVSAFSRLGDYRSAISQLQILLSKDPQDVLSQLELARLYAQVKNWPKALEEARRLQESADKYPRVVLEARLLGLRAQAYILAGGGAADAKQSAWRELESQAEKLDKDTNGDLAVRFLRVQILLMQTKVAEADTLLTELEGRYPSDLRLMLFRAQLCESQEKEADARAKYQEAIAKFPQALDPVQAFAVFLDRRGQKQECETVVKDAFARIQEPQVRRDAGLLLAELYFRWQQGEKRYLLLTDLAAQYPNDIQCMRLLLTCESVRQDEAKSRQIIARIKESEGEQGPLWRYEQASLLMRSKDPGWQEAVEKAREGNPAGLRALPAYLQVTKLLQEALSANPEDLASRLLLAEIYELAGEQQLALTMYREAYSRAPSNSQVLVRLISLLHQVGGFAEAQKYLDKADEQDLLNPALQRLQVDNDLSHDDLDSAVGTLQQLLERDPNDAGLRLSYARVLILRNEFAQAEAILTDLRAKLSESRPSDLMLVARTQVRLYARQGNMDKALQICNEMVDKLHDATAHMLRADVYLALKEDDKALQDLGQAILLEPKNVDTWQKRARVHSSLRRVPEAVSDVRQAMTLVSDEPPAQKLPVQKLAAQVFLASGKQSLWNEADGILAEAMAGQQEKNDPELGVLKAEILVARGTGPAIEEARTLLRQVTSDHPEYADAWKLATRLELGQEELGRALDIASRGLAHNDNDKDLLLLKAIAEKRLSPSVAAMTTLRGLAEAYPDDVGIFIEWADAYARAEHPEKAVALLEEKLPSFTGTAHRRCEIALAAALYSNAQEDKALPLFDRLITADPNDPVPVMTLAGLLRKQSRWTEVNQLVNRWRTMNPKDAETATSVARLLAGSGDKAALQMAEDQLRMILEVNPESVPTLVLLSMMMQDAGRDEEATTLNRRILDLDPNNVIAINNLAWILCERPLPSPAMLKEALALADRGLTLMADYMDLLDTRGVIHYRSGNLDQAIKDFTRCIELFPKDSPQSAAVHFHLARTLADLNRRSEAVDHLRQALILNRKNVQLAQEHASEGRKTHAIKVLRDALAVEEEMEELKTRFTPEDFAGIRETDDWTRARLDLEQLQKGR
ncbi:MAG: tetratricopeptide repeat protein, partial [Phycisphaerales bacterium]